MCRTYNADPGCSGFCRGCDFMNMRCLTDGGTTIWIAPSNIVCSTCSLLELMLNSLFARPTWGVSACRKTSLFCARISMKRSDGSYVGMSMVGLLTLIFAAWWLLLQARLSKVFVFTTRSMTRSVSAFSCGLSSFPVVESGNSELGGLENYSNMMEDFKKKFSWAVAPVCTSIGLVHEVKYSLKFILVSSDCQTLFSRYGLRSMTDQTIARYSRCVMLYRCLVSVSKRA